MNAAYWPEPNSDHQDFTEFADFQRTVQKFKCLDRLMEEVGETVYSRAYPDFAWEREK
jgi:hypothetical protein